MKPNAMRSMTLCLLSAIALAISPVAIAGPQQERMKQCNVDAKAKALKGDERKKFMSTCLKA